MIARWAAFSAAAVACVWLYWPGLITWFSNDDFAWLGLRLSIFNLDDLLSALFSPKAQGTVRPISERLYFLALEKLFGLEPLPFRIVAFATQLLNIWMVLRLAERVTGSLAAGFAAAVLWIANSALGQAMSWSSAYNQLLWPAFMLGGLHSRWTYLETGSRGALIREWALFLLGFGVLELQVVYPILAGALTLLYKTERWRGVLPMFLVAAAYAGINRAMAKPQTNPMYILHWDAGMFQTFAHYLRMALGVWRPGGEAAVEPWQNWLQLGVAPFAVVAFAWAFWKRDKWTLFGAAWFVGTLLPVLPLRDHISDYYLTVPVLGLSFVFGAIAARNPRIAVLPVVLYLASSGYAARILANYNYERAESGRILVEGVKQASARNPGKTILLTAVGSDVYWTVMNDEVFRLLPGIEVYLAPGAEENIQKNPELGDPARHVLAAPVALASLKQDRAVVYSAAGPKLINVTSIWKEVSARRWTTTLAPIVDVAQPLLAAQIGAGWHTIEGTFRWSTGKANVRLGAKPDAREIQISAFRPSDGDDRAAIRLELFVNGRQAGSWPAARGEALKVSAPIPQGVDVSAPVEIELRTVPPLVERGSGGRELGLVFGTIGLR